MTNAEIVAEIEARFHAMAVTYARSTDRLIAWVQQGNKLPNVYVDVPAPPTSANPQSAETDRPSDRQENGV